MRGYYLSTLCRKDKPRNCQTLKSPKIDSSRCNKLLQGAKVNTNSYIKGILTPALVEIKKHFRDEVFTFQQEGAPSHTANKTQTWCEHLFPRFWRKELWPPLSPDSNPLDFCIWSILEKKDMCNSTHQY